MPKPLTFTPEMLKALCHPLPNLHKLWREYAASQFRRDHLATWAGSDPDKQRAVQELLNDTTPSP